MSEFIELKDTEILSIQLNQGSDVQELVVGSINIVPPGPQGPAGPQGPQGEPADPAALQNLQDQIDAIYKPGFSPPAVSNGTFVDGLLHYTGGTLNSFYGLNCAGLLFDHAASLRVTGADFDVWVDSSSSYTSGPYGSQDFMRVTAGGSTLTAMHRDQNGLHILTMLPYTAGTLVDVTFTDTGLRIEHVGNVYESPPLSTPISAPKTKFLSAADTLVIDLQSAATGLLPDETAARISGDAALTAALADVQTLAEANQLNIAGKADQLDLEALQTTVNGQGLTLAQKADQTALDALGTVVSGKATPEDITTAIAALVDGAPAALDTLAELATALAGEQAQIADLLTALALRVRVDAVQSLTLAQQLQARQNINAEAVGVAASLVANITPASIGAATAVQGAKADTALQSADLAPVAFSGAYSALSGLPTIPGLSSSTPAAPTTTGTAGTATTVARGDHAHPLPTSAQITAAVLTGLGTGSATAIAAADSILQALAKLQAQASANAAGVASNAELLAPVPRKIGSSWYVSGRWYDLGYPYGFSITTQSVPGGAVRYFAYSPLETVTLQNIATNIAGAMTAGGTMKFGIYANNNGFPAARIYASSAIAGDTTGVKTAACTQTLTAGTVYWFGIFVSATAVFSANMIARTYGGGAAFGLGGLTHTGLSDITSSGAGAGFTGAGYAPFLSFQVQ